MHTSLPDPLQNHDAAAVGSLFRSVMQHHVPPDAPNKANSAEEIAKAVQAALQAAYVKMTAYEKEQTADYEARGMWTSAERIAATIRTCQSILTTVAGMSLEGAPLATTSAADVGFALAIQAITGRRNDYRESRLPLTENEQRYDNGLAEALSYVKKARRAHRRHDYVPASLSPACVALSELYDNVVAYYQEQCAKDVDLFTNKNSFIAGIQVIMQKVQIARDQA